MRLSRILFAALAVAGTSAAAAEGADWEQVSSFPQGRIFRRQDPGASVVTVQARGVMAAPPWAVRQVVLAPAKYEGVLRGIVEEKVLSYERCEPGAQSLPGCKVQLVYNRLDLPVVSQRDYTIRVELEQDELLSGGEFRESWSVAADQGPAPRDGVVRIRINNGGWVLKPDGSGTDFTYTVGTDPGGIIPSWAANMANNRELPRMIAAVENAAKKLAAEALAARGGAETAAPQVAAESAKEPAVERRGSPPAASRECGANEAR